MVYQLNDAWDLKFEPIFRYSLKPIVDAPIKQYNYTLGGQISMIYNFKNQKCMKTKNYYLSGLLLVVLISLISVCNLQAQTSLKIQGINNSLADYPLQNIKKVFFPTTSILEVDNRSAGAVQVQVSSIKKFILVSAAANGITGDF